MRLLGLLVIIGALVYIGWDTPFHDRLITKKSAEPAPATTAAKPGPAAAEPDYIVLRQPTPVKLKYGSATLPAGLSLHIISKTPDGGVVVDYAGEHVTLAQH